MKRRVCASIRSRTGSWRAAFRIRRFAQHEAIVAVGRTVHKQATIMGFSDTFMALGVMAVVAFILTLFLKKGSGSAAGAH